MDTGDGSWLLFNIYTVLETLHDVFMCKNYLHAFELTCMVWLFQKICPSSFLHALHYLQSSSPPIDTYLDLYLVGVGDVYLKLKCRAKLSNACRIVNVQHGYEKIFTLQLEAKLIMMVFNSYMILVLWTVSEVWLICDL